MKFSLIICGYNEEENLDLCIQSCLDLDYPKDKYEIIYVDNNSIDKSFIIAKDYPIRVFNEEKQGLSEARNCGIKNATGDILVFLDADLKLDKDYLRYHVDTFKDSKVGAGGGKVLPLIKTWVSEYLGVSLFEGYPRFITNKFVRTYPGCNLTITKKVIDNVGVFKEGLITEKGVTRFAEDKEMCERIRIAKYRILYNSRATVYHKNTFQLRQLIKIWFRGSKGRAGMIKAKKKDLFSLLFKFNLPIIALLIFILSFFIYIKISIFMVIFIGFILFSLSIKSFLETRLFIKSFFVKPWMDVFSLLIINIGTIYYILKK